MKRTIKKKKYSKKKYSRNNNSIKRNVNKTKRKSNKRNVNKTKRKSIKKSIKKKNLKGGTPKDSRNDEDAAVHSGEDEEEDYTEITKDQLIERLHEMKRNLEKAATLGSAMTAELNSLEQLKAENALLSDEKENMVAALEEERWRSYDLDQTVNKLNASLQAMQNTVASLSAEVKPDDAEATRLQAAAGLEKAESKTFEAETGAEADLAKPAVREPVASTDENVAVEMLEQSLEEEAQLRRQAEQSAKKLAAQLATQLQLFETERAQKAAAAAQVAQERDAAAQKAQQQAVETKNLQVQLAELERQLNVAMTQQVQQTQAAQPQLHGLAPREHEEGSGASLLDELGEGEVSDSTVKEQTSNDTIFLQRIMEILNLQVRETKSQSERYAEFNELTQNFDTIAKKIESDIEEL